MKTPNLANVFRVQRKWKLVGLEFWSFRGHCVWILFDEKCNCHHIRNHRSIRRI